MFRNLNFSEEDVLLLKGKRIQCIWTKTPWLDRVLSIGKLYIIGKDLNIVDDEGVLRNKYLWNNRNEAVFRLYNICETEEFE